LHVLHDIFIGSPEWQVAWNGQNLHLKKSGLSDTRAGGLRLCTTSEADLNVFSAKS
jgi:hypothetical protein